MEQAENTYSFNLLSFLVNVHVDIIMSPYRRTLGFRWSPRNITYTFFSQMKYFLANTLTFYRNSGEYDIENSL